MKNVEVESSYNKASTVNVIDIRGRRIVNQTKSFE